MRTAGYLGSYKAVLGVKIIRIYLLKGISSDVVIPLSARSQKTAFIYVIFLKGFKDLQLTVFGSPVYLPESLIQASENIFTDVKNPGAYPKGSIYIVYIVNCH